MWIPLEEDDFMPVDPFVTENGDLAALVPVLGKGKARPLPLPPKPPLEARAKIGQISLNAAAKLTAGGIFSGALNFEERAFYCDVLIKSDVSDVSGQTAEMAVVGTRWGAGVRMFIKAFDIKSNTKLNAANIGAAVELGTCKAVFQLAQYGLDALPTLGHLLGQFGGIGRVDARTFRTLRASAAAAFKGVGNGGDSLSAPAIAEVLVPVAVRLNRPLESGDLDRARKALFVLRAIARGRLTFDEINKRINGDPVGLEIWEMYTGADRSDHPPKEGRRNAMLVLADL